MKRPSASRVIAVIGRRLCHGDLITRIARQAFTALSLTMILVELTACGATLPPAHAGSLLSFSSASWTGGELVALPGTKHAFGLELTSVDGAPAVTQYIGRIDLARYDWTRSVLSLRLYLSDASTFNGHIFASRLDLQSDFTGTNYYVLWFDESLVNGWNHIVVPLTELGIVGHPSPANIVEARVIVYSTQRAQTRAYFYSLIERSY